jgi:N-acetylglucosaminyl-diphospho-decaprenol L-rhamnosyltransferase
MRDAGEITLFVVHWNRPKECAATVRAFVEQAPDLRVVIVDNASARPALEELRAKLDSIAKLLPLDVNKGWGPALNIALREWLASGRGDFCLISAHDAQPARDCVAALRKALEQDEKVGIACPQFADRSVGQLSAVHGVEQKIGEPLPAGMAQEIDVPHGTLMAVRCACLREIGLFDERYFAYGDEHELGARARRRGWKVVMVWGATVANPETSTSSWIRSYLFTRNSLLLVHDYFGRFAALFRLVLILLNTIRLAFASRGNGFAFLPRARWQGCYDFLLGRFGPPAPP